MFSRCKKDQATQPITAAAAPAPRTAREKAPLPDAPATAPVTAPARETKLRAEPAGKATKAGASDKEARRKERLGEIKLELHKALLDNLNLAALENASEADLRGEITAIASESLAEMEVVLNREERQTLNQDLYHEVVGLGPLEPLLKDDDVADILINGPKQIFIEKKGELQVSDITFKDEKHLLGIIDRSSAPWAGGSMNRTPTWTPASQTARAST